MKIGETQTITDMCFPDKEIYVLDRKGNKLRIRDKVRIYGCAADYGYIGYSNGRVMVYFEAHKRSVKWWVDEKVRQKIELWQDRVEKNVEEYN